MIPKKLIYSTLIALFSLLSTLNSVAVTFIVDNAGDTDDLLGYTVANGTNTLRKCIRLANSNVNGPIVDLISFANLPIGGPYTILPASNYQAIIDPVLIDGFTAPGYTAPTPYISILGAGAAATTSPIVNVFNLGTGSSGSTIRGFSLYRTTDVAIYISGASNITVAGCYIGLTQTGTLPTPANSQVGNHGIYVTTNSNNCIFGTATAAGKNVISGTLGHGICLVSCSGGTFYNNFIGTNVAGNAAIPNAFNGLNIDTTTATIIGGAAVNQGNLISGNTESGIILTRSSSNAIIKGNKIGTNLAGTAAVANGQHGLSIYTNVFNTIIGGTAAGEGNLISGNIFNGINIDINSKKSVIKGNYIGTDITGTLKIGNLWQGIYINASDSSTIGGGSKAARNIVSGNGTSGGQNGIGIVGSNTNTIQGNFCGISSTGKIAIPNFDTGISLTNSNNNTIGGASYMQRNVSSANGILGMYFFNVNNSTITGNYFGTDSTGNAPLGNVSHGVHTDGGCNLNVWKGNVAGGNGAGGMDLLTSTNSTYYGNYLGLGINGITPVGNFTIGFRFGASSTNNTVGGSAAGQRNYMSGNNNHGMMFDGQSVSNIVKGNYVGCDTSGLTPVPNKTVGLLILDVSNNTIIGGSALGEGNIFCCSDSGTGIQSQISSNAIIYGNLIGVNKNGVLANGFGNYQDGIWLMSYQYLSWANNSNVVGGLGAGQPNIIANNNRDGVRISGYSANAIYNSIIGNKIYCNSGVGIHFETGAVYENEGILSPNVTSSTTNVVSGTGTTGNTIHVYRNQYSDGPRCTCQGEIYVGTTVVAGGTWSLTHNLGLTAAQALSVTATQTDPNHSTSPFWVCSVPLPVDLLSLSAKRNNNDVIVSFIVTNESKITMYNIMHSRDGINFEMIGSVVPINGAGGITSYSYTDSNPTEGTNYYKIQVVENNGVPTYSKIVQASVASGEIFLYPNPATDEVKIASSNTLTRIELHSTVGQLVFEKNIAATEIIIPLSGLATGVYFVKVYDGENASIYKLEKK
jgi:hypothetical protein